MDRKTISRAMRDLAKWRHAHEDKQRTRAITSNAAKALWDKLTPAEKDARIAHMRAGLKRKGKHAGDSLAQPSRLPSRAKEDGS
jgi:hypothetical protein